MLTRIDSRALALFLAVADALSFRQAAQTLHMSQPPLSRAIREFEERLGVQLFERMAKGVRLTAAGETLLPYARDVARTLRRAQAALATAAPPQALRLGLTSAVEPPWFRGLDARLRAQHASAEISIVSDTSPRLVRQLRAGRLDGAFIALPTECEGLDVLTLDRLPMIIAMQAGHPLARRRALRLADLAAESVFWFERARQPAFYDHCQRIFARHGFAPRKRAEPADHHVLLAEVADGRGMALLPASFKRLQRDGVVYRRLIEGDELAVRIGLAMPKDRATWRAALVTATGLTAAAGAP